CCSRLQVVTRAGRRRRANRRPLVTAMNVHGYRAALPLLRRASLPSTDGVIGEFAAPSGGWEYIDMGAYRLRAGQRVQRAADDRERLVLVLEGRAAVCVGANEYGVMGSRETVFDGPPPPVVLVAAGQPMDVVADTEALVVVAGAPGGEVRRTACIAPEEMRVAD